MSDNKGALWLKKSRDKKTTYMSGHVQIDGKKHYLKVFKNTRKNKDNQPDYSIVFDTEEKR